MLKKKIKPPKKTLTDLFQEKSVITGKEIIQRIKDKGIQRPELSTHEFPAAKQMHFGKFLFFPYSWEILALLQPTLKHPPYQILRLWQLLQ